MEQHSGRVALRHRLVTILRSCPDGEQHLEEVALQAGLPDEVFVEALERESARPCRGCSQKLLAEAASQRDPEQRRQESLALWPD